MPEPAFLQHIILTLGIAEITGEHPTVPALADSLRRFSLEEVFQFCEKVSSMLGASDDSQLAQVGLAQLFFPADLRERAWRVQRRHERQGKRVAYFHQSHLLNLLKYALLLIEPESPSTGADATELTRCMLWVSTLTQVDPTQEMWRETPAQPEREAWQQYLMANALLNRRPNALASMARTIWLYLLEHPEVTEDQMSVPVLLERVVGLPPKELWALLFGLLPGWQFQSPQEAFAAEVGRDIDHYFARFSLTPQAVTRLEHTLVVDVGDLQTLARRRYSADQVRPFDFVVFRQAPLVRFGRRVYCPEPKLLTESMQGGVHHLCMRRDSTSREERDKFLRYMGHVFAAYAHALFERVQHHSRTAARYWRLDDFSHCLPSGQRADALFVQERQCAVIEMKAKLFDADSVAGESFSNTIAKLRETFLRSARQIDSTIRALRAGALARSGFPARVARFYPVIVTLQPIPLDPVTLAIVKEEVARENLLLGDDVAQFQSMDIDDLEVMEFGLRSTSLVRLLGRKCDWPWRDEQFNHFIASLAPEEMPRGHSPFLRMLFEGWSTSATLYFERRRNGRPNQ